MIDVLRECLGTFELQLTWPGQFYVDNLLNAAKPAREYDDFVGEKNSLDNLVRDKKYGLPTIIPNTQKLRLHNLATLRIQSRERLVHQQHLGLYSKRTRADR